MFELNDGDILFDRFEIERLLGHGGMGEVYKARDTKLERLVAIKTIKLKNFKDPIKAKERFLREGKLTARLDHPHIVKVHDLLENDNQLYLVMEYLEGESLAHKLKNGALPREDALRIYDEIKQALTYLHKLEGGILHRDVSPHNIFIQKQGKAKLLDYGVSKVEEIDSNQTETYHYKLSYTCPDLWKNGVYHGKLYSTFHDFYSLSLIAYEMLTGKRVFKEMEALSGYPGEIHPSGVSEIDEIILGKKSDPTLEVNLKATSPRRDQIAKLAILFAFTSSILIIFYSLNPKSDKDIIVLYNGKEHFLTKRPKPERFSSNKLTKEACISRCFTLQTYPSLYVDGESLAIEEVSRLLDERWNHYQSLKNSSCMRNNPYCELAYRVSSEFKFYMENYFKNSSYDDFKIFLEKRLGKTMAYKEINHYLSNPHKYSSMGDRFYDYMDSFTIPNKGRVLPQKKRVFFFLDDNKLGGKYHLIQDKERLHKIDYDYCKEYGDMAYASYLNHLFYKGSDGINNDFQTLIFGKDWYGEVMGKDRFTSPPIRFRLKKQTGIKDNFLCRYKNTSQEKIEIDLFVVDLK